jgi:predicted MFS family arabinose efflux permease
VAIGLLVMAAGGAVAAVAQGFGLLALARVATGVGFVFGTVYMTKMVADWFAGKELATAMSVLVMSWPFGIAMGQIGHAWIAAAIDWRAAFAVAAAYCAAGGVAVFVLYRPPAGVSAPAPTAAAVGLPRAELVLTLLAAAAWGLFNAGYIVYLSFAPQVLVAGGYGTTQAAAVISVASWVLIFSGAACGQIADRSGKRDLLVYGCLSVAIMTVLLLPQTSLALGLSLLFGLVGVAPAGVIMALTGEAMAPQRRAFGMGVFYSFYFVLVTVAPPIAGWLYDRSGKAYLAIVFAALLFAATAAANWAFRVAKRRLVAR